MGRLATGRWSLPEVNMAFVDNGVCPFDVALADAMQRAASHVAREQRPRLVVCSAVGGVTDLLLQAVACARCGDDPAPFVGEIRARHGEIVAKLALDAGVLARLDSELDRLLQGVGMLRELTPRVQDELVSLGERMSVRLFAAVLERSGLAARAFDSWELGLQTDDRHGSAEVDPGCLGAVCEAVGGLEPGLVPVVTGFIGRGAGGAVTTLGRGGSDLSAAVLGAAVDAGEIQIWTDVPGILRADPRVVGEAEIVPAIRFDEAAELAYFGAKVLHPRTIEPARRRGIPVRVLGTFQVDPARPVVEQGTLIHDAAPGEPVRAIALRRGVQSLHVCSSRMLQAPGFLSRVFDILARHGISVDVIATSEVSVSMTFDRDEQNLAAAMGEIAGFAQVEHTPDRSILCLVGTGIREDTSILARIFGVLAKHRVPVHVISQGASRINITLVTEAPHGRNAMRALHQAFFG